MTHIPTATLILIVGLLSACGFQLAGTATTGLTEHSFHVTGGSTDFRTQLQRTFMEAGIGAADAADSDYMIRLSGPDERRTVVSVNTTLDAREYEVGLFLTVEIRARGEEYDSAVKLSRFRHWSFEPERYLASDEEYAVIIKELQQELIDALQLVLKARVASAAKSSG